MSLEYSFCPISTFFPISKVYVLIVQFMTLEYSLCPNSTVYVPSVQFLPY